MGHAYLVAAHHQMQLLQILLHLIDDERNEIYLHVDKKCKEFKEEDFRQTVKKAKIHFIERRSVTSVREPNGKKWLEQLIGREVPIIADPTLLLSHEEWLQSFSIPQMDEKFIFNYAFFHNRPEANAAIQKISEEMGMPVYVLDNKSWAAYRLDNRNIGICILSCSVC